MARLKEETLNLILNVKGDKARKEINDTEKAIADSKTRVAEYRKEMRLLAQQGQTNSARYKEPSRKRTPPSPRIRKSWRNCGPG